MSIGDKIAKLRKEAGITMTELAKKAQISVSYLNDIEKGRSNPSIDTLKAIAKGLGIPPGQLLDTENKSPIEEDWPEVFNVLRRSGKKPTPEDRRRIARIIKAAIEDTDEE